MRLKKQKNFFFTFFLIIFFWSILALMIFFTEPQLVKDILIPNSYCLFFLNLFLALFFTSAVIFKNTRRGFLISLSIVSFLTLKMFSLGNIINALLILSFALTCDYYFTHHK